MGTLACITTGFEVAARNPVLIVLPLMLDLFLWLGPRLSIAPILQGVMVFLNQWLQVDPSSVQASDAASLLSQILEELSKSFNLFSLLHPAPLLGVPVLMSGRLSAVSPLGPQPAVEIASMLLLLACAVVLTVAGLGLSSLYLEVVGRRVISETDSPLPGPMSMWVIWQQFVKLALLLFVILFSFSMVLSFFAGLIGFLSLTLAGLVMTLASSVVLFIGVHLLFTVPGIVLLRRGLLRAMKESLLLTRGDFINVIFLLGLILVISRGLGVVWALPEAASWATIVGLAGHAFVSTALTAALLVFYQERLRYLGSLQQLSAAQPGEAKAHPVAGE